MLKSNERVSYVSEKIMIMIYFQTSVYLLNPLLLPILTKHFRCNKMCVLKINNVIMKNQLNVFFATKKQTMRAEII